MNIEDAHIISETMNDTPSASKGLPTWLVSVADLLTTGRKGKMATDALAAFNLVKDPATLRTIYSQNESVINDYFNQIDLNKVNDAFGGNAKPAMKVLVKDIAVNNIPGLLIGLGVGAALGGLFLRRNPEIVDDIMEAWND